MELKNRILEISKKHKLSHIGSCLSCLPVLEEIYKVKQPGDKVVLSNGHAHLAHLVVKEKYEGLENIEKLLEKGGIHCDRSVGCDVSTGSLGHGLGIALGLALADRSRQVYCIISDGECSEGSIWEALRLKESLDVENLEVHVNANGWGAYDAIDLDKLEYRLAAFDPTIIFHKTSNEPMPDSLAAHYMSI